MELLACALREQEGAFMDQLDLVFKWVSLRLCEKENVKAMAQVSTKDWWASICVPMLPSLLATEHCFCPFQSLRDTLPVAVWGVL